MNICADSWRPTNPVCLLLLCVVTWTVSAAASINNPCLFERAACCPWSRSLSLKTAAAKDRPARRSRRSFFPFLCRHARFHLHIFPPNNIYYYPSAQLPALRDTYTCAVKHKLPQPFVIMRSAAGEILLIERRRLIWNEAICQMFSHVIILHGKSPRGK